MALRKARASVASAPEVEAAAEELLGKGNAVDAVVAGVFAAAAISPGVLLGPVQILVGGAGAGLLAIDGRVRQPGIGAPRPRGFTTGDDIPDGNAYETVAGFVMAGVGRLPRVGDVVAVPGATVRVDRMEGRRVDRLRVVPEGTPGGGDPS